MGDVVKFSVKEAITPEDIEAHWETLRQTAENLLIIGGKPESYAKGRSTRLVTEARLQFAQQLESGELNAVQYDAAVCDAVLDEAYRIAGRPRPTST